MLQAFSSLLAFLVAFALITASHGFMLLRARSADAEKRRRLWRLHSAINGTLWVLLLVWLLWLHLTLPGHHLAWPLRAAGVVIVVAAVMTVAWARTELGRDQAMGVRFFFPERSLLVQSGPYRFLRDPMYDSFVAALIGLWLTFGIAADAVLAAASFVFLSLWLARIERSGLPPAQ